MWCTKCQLCYCKPTSFHGNPPYNICSREFMFTHTLNSDVSVPLLSLSLLRELLLCYQFFNHRSFRVGQRGVSERLTETWTLPEKQSTTSAHVRHSQSPAYHPHPTERSAGPPLQVRKTPYSQGWETQITVMVRNTSSSDGEKHILQWWRETHLTVMVRNTSYSDGEKHILQWRVRNTSYSDGEKHILQWWWETLVKGHRKTRKATPRFASNKNGGPRAAKIRIRIFIVPVQVYKEKRLLVWFVELRLAPRWAAGWTLPAHSLRVLNDSKSACLRQHRLSLHFLHPTP